MRRYSSARPRLKDVKTNMNMQTWKRATALLTVVAFLTTGCTSLQNVPLSQNGQSVQRPAINAGESVVVTKKDGTKQKFKVSKVEDDALVGQNVRISYADMASLEAQRSDGTPSKKALIIGGAVLGAVVIAVAAGSGGGGGGY
jgi:uncharacterized protein YcfL